MAIGNILRGIFNGAKEIGSHLPVVGHVIKQGEDTLGQIGNVGDNLFTTKSNQPSSYNQQADDTQQGQSGNDIGNLVSRPQAAAADTGAAKTMTGAANAAKQAAAAEEAASEIAMML
jgi:hypothetical protein